MLFNSFHFIWFFALVVILYYLLPHRFRWLLLLVSSYYFYMCWRPELVLLILFSTLTTYIFARRIENSRTPKERKQFLLLSLFLNLGLLFIFKYTGFFYTTSVWLISNGIRLGLTLTGTAAEDAIRIGQAILTKGAERTPSLILPLGISFYTFQAVGYTVDVYRGNTKAERHLGIFALFKIFFPQLVAGPIERSRNLLPQFRRRVRFRWDEVLLGLQQMLLGFLKKIVIADRAAIAVNLVYQDPQSYGSFSLLLATILFALQIYCDFSGYSEIALGSARVLGFSLMNNFDKPYLASSIKEFWRRWHISLSTWFMDYVYIPLGGSKQGRLKQCRNLMLTFLVSGLWHGASWTFVLWGGLHGLYQCIGVITRGVREQMLGFLHMRHSPLRYLFGIIFTLCLVLVGWVFFRANTAQEAIYILSQFPALLSEEISRQSIYSAITSMGLNLMEWRILLFSIGGLALMEIISGKKSILSFWKDAPYLLRLGFYVLVGYWILTTGVFESGGEFIYFQF